MTGELRQPPQDLDSERIILAACILDAQLADEILPRMKPEHFYAPAHRLIFSTIQKLHETNQPLDLVNVRNTMRSAGQLELVGGVDYLVGMVESCPSVENTPYYSEKVITTSQLREVIRCGYSIIDKAHRSDENPAELIQQFEAEIFALCQRPGGKSAATIRQIMGDVLLNLDARRHSTFTGLATGFLAIDNILGGIRGGELIIMASRPSMGKTALGLNQAENISIDAHLPVAFFSLEMPADQLCERILSSRAKIDSYRLRRGQVTAAEYGRIVDLQTELAEAPLFIIDDGGLTPAALRSHCRRLKAQHGIQAVFVDYVQLMTIPGQRDRYQEVSLISRQLKTMAMELDLPVIVLAQLNRAVEARENHRPRMSDLRESGQLEQDADVIMLLHREDYYRRGEKDYHESQTCEVLIAKNRHGPIDDVKLLWQGTFCRFESLAAEGSYR